MGTLACLNFDSRQVNGAAMRPSDKDFLGMFSRLLLRLRSAAEEEDPSFLATRRRSSLLAAPRVEYAPFLEVVKTALSENKNEYLTLFKRCGSGVCSRSMVQACDGCCGGTLHELNKRHATVLAEL